MTSDKMNLLHLMNNNAKVAVKTPFGSADRVSIGKVVMQGTVWGILMCTATMDKLGKLKYNNKEMLYKYQGTVDIPALEMVDDIFDIQTFGINAVMSNAVVNSFIEHKTHTQPNKVP